MKMLLNSAWVERTIINCLRSVYWTLCEMII